MFKVWLVYLGCVLRFVTTKIAGKCPEVLLKPSGFVATKTDGKCPGSFVSCSGLDQWSLAQQQLSCLGLMPPPSTPHPPDEKVRSQLRAKTLVKGFGPKIDGAGREFQCNDLLIKR